MSAYELIDFGDGRKLERLGGLVVDRPSPAAIDDRPAGVWSNVDARFELRNRHQGIWHFAEDPPHPWTLETWFGRMQLFPTEFGHVGVFPEQQGNWKWLRESLAGSAGLRVLNLFAYTGGSTLAAAATGCQVTHVDSAKNIVRRARENAALCDLQDRPVRWIVEDALKFVQREVRRGKQYDGVILDPPSYGHGPAAKTTWKIERDLPELLKSLGALISQCRLFLFTCHSPGYTVAVLRNAVADHFQIPSSCHGGPLAIATADGRSLSSGNFLRWFVKLDS